MMKRFGRTVAQLLGRAPAGDAAAGEDSAPGAPAVPPAAPAADPAAADLPALGTPAGELPADPPIAATAPELAPRPASAPEPVVPASAPERDAPQPPPLTPPADSTAAPAGDAMPPSSAPSGDDAGAQARDDADTITEKDDASEDEESDDEVADDAEDETDDEDDDDAAPDDDEPDDDNESGEDEEEESGDRVFFGEEVFGASARHRSATADTARLARFNLPEIASEQALAGWLGLPLGRLRWYTQDRPADTTWHYVRHTVPKRGGGERVILAPKRALKELQRKVLADIVARVPTAEAAHGFVRGHSIVTNARQHTGKAAVLKLDLQDFFPSITFARVRGLFIALGYSFSVASILALLCTEHERESFDRESTRYYVSIGPRHLVQGAPTSPGLANLVAWRLDRRLAGVAAKHGLTYTRYADDLTFSGEDYEALRRLRNAIERIVRDEHFSVNRAKTRLAGRSTRQIVTGLVVNEAVAVPRAQRRRLRALLHNAAASGLAAQNRASHPRFRAYLQGQIAHIHAANPEHAARLRAALERAAERDA